MVTLSNVCRPLGSLICILNTCMFPASKYPLYESNSYPFGTIVVGSSIATITLAHEFAAPGPPPVPPS